MSVTVLSKEKLFSLFSSCVHNAFSLWTAASNNIDSEETIHISLGLGELALEELGKSYTCLAHICVDGSENIWKQFWKDWKNHTVKAHRAFFYESFCLWRIEVGESCKVGPTIRSSIPTEKELSFYVDYDKEKDQIIRPFEKIGKEEIFSRIGSVVGPLNTALKVEDLLVRNKSIDYWNSISKYALFTILDHEFQQDVEKILSKLKNGNEDNDKALKDIWMMFNTNELQSK